MGGKDKAKGDRSRSRSRGRKEKDKDKDRSRSRSREEDEANAPVVEDSSSSVGALVTNTVYETLGGTAAGMIPVGGVGAASISNAKGGKITIKLGSTDPASTTRMLRNSEAYQYQASAVQAMLHKVAADMPRKQEPGPCAAWAGQAQ